MNGRIVNALLLIGFSAATAVAWSQDTIWTWLLLSGLAYACAVSRGERRARPRPARAQPPHDPWRLPPHPVALADRLLTPGALADGVTLAEVLTPGYSRRVRPSRARAWLLKLAAMRRYGYSRLTVHRYTLDHLVPLECGGHPTAAANLWPQLVAEAKVKDVDENAMRAGLVAGTGTLADVAEHFRERWTI